MESPSMLLESMNKRLSVWYEWNRWDEAREVATSILQTSEQYQQDTGWQLRALRILAELAYRTGQQEESDKLLRQHKRLFEQSSSQPLLLPAIHAAHEDWTLALADQQELVRRAEPFPSPAELAYLAELTALANAPSADQKAICKRAVTQARQAGASKFLAISLRARGLMYLEQEHWDKAEQDLRAALASFKTLDLPWEQGQTLSCLGQLYKRRPTLPDHEQPAAREHNRGLAKLFYEQALGFFESLHAVHAAQRVREALARDTPAAV